MSQRTPAIMIQGTCSNAGKSLLTAAFCRIFAQDGLNPAPFKAQNMALNSFVTPEGCEIGRAQALQAVACGREPHTHMNPVLLKPHSDMGAQVLVLGKPVGHMRVREYVAYKPTAWRHVTEAYAALSATADVMVIEGAGSPAEINLKSHDIVNMAMAKHAGAPVLLCADIDRGGAFASLVGTMALLDAEESDLVAGFILNKFRGDASLLDTAFAPITAMTGKPFLGTVPWIGGLNLPEEDSVSFRLQGYHADLGGEQAGVADGILDVAVVDLPHMSNLSDMDALRVEPDVRLRIVRKAEDLGRPHVLLLLGTKNTLADMAHLQRQGLAAVIQEQAKYIPCILGVCGGLQMLGQSITDPEGLESATPQSHAGLGLLPLQTRMGAEKQLRRCEARYTPSGQAPQSHGDLCTPSLVVHGYEIHHGESTSPLAPALQDQEGRAVGWEVWTEGRRILGTYVHGILDNDAFRRQLLDGARQYLGWAAVQKATPYSLGPDLDRLAETVRQSVDMDAVYALLHK